MKLIGIVIMLLNVAFYTQIATVNVATVNANEKNNGKSSTKSLTAKKRVSSSPIKITANRLEIRNNKNLAIFYGNVVAKQGEIEIRSDKMLVDIRKESEKGEKGKTKKKGETKSKMTIKKVTITDNVSITTDKEKAMGQKAIYYIDSEQIILTGKVTLWRGKNFITGDKLIYNLQKGDSKLLSTNKRGRVRGIFYPQNKNLKQDKN